MQQTTFRSIGKPNKRLRCDVFLDEMKQVVPWAALCEAERPYYYDAARPGRGRQATDLARLLRIVCLQQWYALSDPGVEEALYDRLSFQRLVGLDAFVDTIPDETRSASSATCWSAMICSRSCSRRSTHTWTTRAC